MFERLLALQRLNTVHSRTSAMSEYVGIHVTKSIIVLLLRYIMGSDVFAIERYRCTVDI